MVIIWECKVKDGVSVKDVEEIFKFVVVECNMCDVGVLLLFKEFEVCLGKKEKLFMVYFYCSLVIVCKMVDFSFYMVVYLFCCISVVEYDDGSLWFYILNMDMMVKMGCKLFLLLKEEVWVVCEIIW